MEIDKTFADVEEINTRVIDLNAKHKMCVYISAVVLLAAAVFSIMIFCQSPSLIERHRQKVPIEYLHQGLNNLEMMDDGTLVATSDHNWIVIHLDTEMPVINAIITVRNISVVTTSGRLLPVRPGESIDDNYNIWFELNNGQNVIEIPYGVYERMLLHLTFQEGVSMYLESVIFRNYTVMEIGLFVIYITIFLLISLLLWLLMFGVRGSTVGIENKTPTAVLCCVASMLMPSIFLFFQYNQNRFLTHLVFNHLIIWFIFLSALGVLLFFVLFLIFKSYESSLIISILFWISFWFFEAVYSNISDYATNWIILILLILLVLSVCLLVLRLQQVYAGKDFISNPLSFAVYILFLINIFPAVQHQMILQFNQHRADNFINAGIIIDSELPHPDIFWIHLDEVISLEAFEKFFGTSKSHVRDEIISRGFLLYEDAKLLNAGTQLALPALFSPSLYDSILGRIIQEDTSLLPVANHMRIVNRLRRYGLDHFDFLRDLELFLSLQEVGYEIILHAPQSMSNVYGIPFHRHYSAALHRVYYVNSENNLRKLAANFLSGEMSNLISKLTPLSAMINAIFHYIESSVNMMEFSAYTDGMPLYFSDRQRILQRNFIQSFERDNSSPRFMFIMLLSAHPATWSGWDGYNFAARYKDGFDEAIATALNLIDIILYDNPDAVIILQADHGIRINHDNTWSHNLGLKASDEVSIGWSVFSAVRIPKAYGGLSIPLHPLNISRELTNRFVGENYTLLTRISYERK